MIFPNSRRILWSREPTGKPHFIHSADVMPPLYLSPSAMVSLVDSCDRSSTERAKTMDRVASIVPVRDVLDALPKETGYFQGPWKTVLGNTSYVIELSDKSDGSSLLGSTSNLVGPAVNSNMTIPVSFRADWADSLDFDQDSTS